MKKRTIIKESEKSEILSMHKALMKEQTQPQVPVTNTEKTPIPGEEQLRKAVAAGCLGQPDNRKFRTNTDRTKIVYRTTTESGKEIDFYGDMTYKFRDGSKLGKWKCDKVGEIESQKEKETQLSTDAQTKKQSYIDKFTKPPYNYTLNVDDINKQNYIELDPVKDLKVPVGVFSSTDKFYSNPSVNKDIKGGSDSILNGILENQSINRNACRKNIEDYYKSFKRKNSIVIDDSTFNQAKTIVQSCKDEHYGNWGALGGGKNWDNILDIMSGGSGGPLSYGEDAKWRLK